jgi:hypothetical protein
MPSVGIIKKRVFVGSRKDVVNSLIRKGSKMDNKIKGTRFDPQTYPCCESKLKSGKPMYRWICQKCGKGFAISNGGLGNEIVEVT